MERGKVGEGRNGLIEGLMDGRLVAGWMDTRKDE